MSENADPEEAFRLTNMPPDELDKKDHEKLQGFQGPSLSVGDVVEIESSDGEKKKFLCCSFGWEQRNEPAKEMREHTTQKDTPKKTMPDPYSLNGLS
jgi:hypothetical protein